MKTCNVCHQQKPLSDFSAHKIAKDGYRNYCKPCGNALSRECHIRRKYGLSVAEYDALMQSPCSICGTESSHLDHDHNTGKLRRPLCTTCNLMLGLSKDSPDILRDAADYLESF